MKYYKKNKGKNFKILLSISNYIRYTADKIKKKRVVTLYNIISNTYIK